jgi:ubiquinone/menaquinone biosynthesis C-methylase UbiE
MIYDKIAKGYDRALAPLEKRFLQKWRQETTALLPENSSILEIGAGTGANFRFYPSVKNAVASDISVKMLEIARKNERKNERHRFRSSRCGNFAFCRKFF